MPKRSQNQPDVLVLGEHPAAYLSAALLCLDAKTKLDVVHAPVPGERVCVERFELINPAFFDLHECLRPLRKKIPLTPVFGIRFLADDASTHSEHHVAGKTPIAYVAAYRDIRDAVREIALSCGVTCIGPKHVEIRSLDEHGLDVRADDQPLRPKALVLGGELSGSQEKMLGLPDGWGEDVVHRYTLATIDSPDAPGKDAEARPMVSMSLDLRGMLCWAWALPHGGRVQIAVEQPLATVGRAQPQEMLRHWAGVLRKHDVLRVPDDAPDRAQSVDIPFAGALAHEGVANRTLLVGPAGGFYSATGESIYPNCWSALYAAEVIRKALKELHLQDAIQAYRQRWRTTLGDYLRGPQQNLRFLLPLIYRNQVMTTRLAESILLGKSVVR